MTRIARIAAAVLVLLAVGPVPRSIAQGVQTGTIRGTVSDQQELPLPGVTVTMSSPALQGVRTGVTAGDGSYLFRSLPPGDYAIAFELAAFDSVKRVLTVPLGGAVEQNVTLQAAGVSQSVQVVAATPGPIATPVVGLNIRQNEVEALATPRTLQGIASLSPGVTENTPNADQLAINGAFAFDNVFMLNGVDVNDNLFGSPQNLFIEDAIAETQVITSGISAEYGRFSGGVINAVTKSGGNTFSGSLRVNLTNPAWVNETPFEIDHRVVHEGSLNDTYEATFGGPIAKDRLWFFSAGRLARSTTSGALPQTGTPNTATDDNKRGEIKLTATAAANQTVQGGYLNNHSELDSAPSFDFSIDRASLTQQTRPNWYAFANYRGVLRTNLLAEAQYSERRYTFEGVGGTSPAMIDSPFLTLTQDQAQYNAPYFDATDPEERNNRQLTANLTYFAQAAGRHEVKGGYEWFRSQETGGNSQSSTSYVFNADYLTDVEGRPAADGAGYVIPVFVPGATKLEHWIAERGAALNVDTSSLFIQDHWSLNRRISADLGLRYERVRSSATGGLVGIDTSALVPRLALAYDVKGDGRVVLHTTYGHYSGRYNEAQIGANSTVANPSETIGAYRGPAGQGRDFAPGFDPANYETYFGQFPTRNVSFESGLSSPITKEFTVSGGSTLGARGYAEASYVWRHTVNLIEDFITTANGFTDISQDGIDYGTFTNIVYRNSDVPSRRYQGLVIQARYSLQPNWTVNGFWTVQLKNEGNYEGERANQPGATSRIGDFPEGFSAERNFPLGRLTGFQRHRARLWSIYTFRMKRAGDLSVSGLWRIESGRVYDLAAESVTLTAIQQERLAAYPDPPLDQTLYFGGRGTETFAGYAVVDASINYDVPLFRSIKPWLKFDVFNLFNDLTLIGFNTAVVPDSGSPVDALGLPTGYVRGPQFGQAQENGNFPASLGAGSGRTFRVSFGLRF